MSIRRLLAVVLAVGGVWGEARAQEVGSASATLELSRFQGMAVGARVDVASLRLADDHVVDLQLERFNALSEDGRVVVAGVSGQRELSLDELVLLRGVVAGEPGSSVFLSISPYGTNGFVRGAELTHFISSGPYAGVSDAPLDVRVVASTDVPAADPGVPFCGAVTEQRRRDGSMQGVSAGDLPCRVARVAVETDWEFTADLFGGNTSASAAYALSNIAAIGEIYQENVNTRLLVSFLRVWEDAADPYDSDSPNLHLLFREYWNDFEDDIDRNVAHMLTARSNLPYGGIAWLNGLCGGSNGYGVSGHLNGSFPYPIEHNHGGNWDLLVVAHELGHNFGSVHTHDYNPPIDGCGLGDCSQASEGTIMSYCHTCSGGVSNISLSFHPLLIVEMAEHMDGTNCGLPADDGATALDDSALTVAEPVIIDVLYNDLVESCDHELVTVESFDALTPGGGSVEVVPAGGSFDRDRLQYTPSDSFQGQESFQYTLASGSSANVTVDVYQYRPPDATGDLDPGVYVAYYELEDPQALPDFDALEPYEQTTASAINYPSSQGAFASSGLSDEVGAVYTGYFLAPSDNLYTLATKSNEGSRLYIGNQLIVDNDGLHGMIQKTGLIALEAGPHALRVEFFENTGAAGLIVGMGDLEHSVNPILPTFYRIGEPASCAADVTGDGTVDVTDLVTVIVDWGLSDSPADINGDGTVDVSDLVLIIQAWGSC